jgi:hypothetical protein
MDRLSFDLSTGRRTVSSNYAIIQDDGSSAVAFDGGQFEDLFDMRPSNYVTIAHDTKQFFINIDTGMGSDATAETNFLAILGHNFHTSDAIFNVWYDDDVNFGSATNVAASSAPTDIINGEADSNTNYVDPASNGWTLITWANDNTDNRYYRIIITSNIGTATNFSTDVEIGCIMLGEYIDFPHSPDMNVKFDIDYDGTDLITSSGGSTFANTSYLGSPVWGAGNPWVLEGEDTATYKSARHYGRRKWNMNFSYVADTDMFLSNMHAPHSTMIDGSDLYSQFFAKSLGSHQPFLFTIDKDSTDEGDYGLYRLADGGLKSTQTANRFWNTNLNLVEHW